MIRFIAAFSCLKIICLPALALEPPVIWRDPDTGCAYVLTPQGGVSPRLRRDGVVDCPDASASSRFVDDAMRGLSQGLETLQRELEGLRERLRHISPDERLEEKPEGISHHKEEPGNNSAVLLFQKQGRAHEPTEYHRYWNDPSSR